MLGHLRSIACVAGLFLILGASASAQKPGRILTPPTFSLGKGTPVRIEEADRLLRARAPAARPTALRIPPTASRATAPAVSCGSGSEEPAQIVALAASLKGDPDLIFEYVYNNIEYEPLFGSNKGALGTLLDQRGDDIDQAQLFTALLCAAGIPSGAMSYEYAYIRLNGAQASGWLGVKDDLQAIAQLLANGGIPLSLVKNSSGTLVALDVAHFWVQLQIDGTTYAFDPSFKQHAVSTGLGNLLPGALGYVKGTFLDDAGGVIDSVSVANLNRAGIRSDLVGYANSLINYIKSNNPAWTLNDVVGGKTIEYLTGSPLRQTSLPYLSPDQPSGFPQNWGNTVPNAYRTCFTISMPGVTPTSCSAPSAQTIQLYSDQTYGHRITVFSIGSSCASGGSCTPTLLIDGQPPPNGQSTGTPASFGSPWQALTIEITHPYTGDLATAADQSTAPMLTAGGSYLIGAGWGQVGRGMVEYHRQLLAQAVAAGNSPTSEAVLGESLAVISYTWLTEVSSAQRLGDAVGPNGPLTTQYHHGVGITAQTEIQQTGQQGPYVDLPLNFVTMEPQTNYTGGGIPPSVLGAFYTLSGVSSSLESAVLEQTQALTAGMQAASTVRLVDINAGTEAKTFFADGTTSTGVTAYFNNIRPNLTGYSATDLNFIDYAISTTGTSTGNPTGQQLLLPANGNIAVGLWSGAGYTISKQVVNPDGSYSIAATQKISGGLSGGFSGSNIPPEMVVSSTQTEMPPAPANTAVPSGVVTSPPAATDLTAAEPVDAITGAYVYQNTDLVTGGGAFPYALPFTRHYTSSSNLTDLGLGNGWTSGYNIAVSHTSDPYRGFGFAAPVGAPAAIAATADMGENSAIDAAAAVAAIYVSQDLLSGAESAKSMTVAWLVNRWLTDQLTNNAAVVTWPATSEEFTLLPHADGAPSLTYSPPIGSAVLLTGVSDQHGNFTFTYRMKDQEQITFNPVGLEASGQIASWTFPDGMSLSFAYNYSYGGASYLTKVSNSLGRSLTLAYSGAHVTGMTDDTGRQIAYGYSGNDLASYSDPLGAVTRFAYDISGTYDTAGHLTRIFYPSEPTNPFVTNWYDALGRVRQQANAAGDITSFYLAGSRTEIIDAAGDRHVTYQTPGGRVIKDARVLSGSSDVFTDTAQQNGVVDVTSNQYDGLDRLILATLPEGSTVSYTYSPDLEQNVIAVTRTAKPGSPLTPLVTSYAYDPLYNKPTSITDPLGLLTTFSYDPATGNLLSSVADAGGSGHFNATARYTYNGYGRVLTATDPLGTVTAFIYDGHGNPTTIIRDSGAGRLNQTTVLAYSPSGDVVALTDPNGNITTRSYGADRRLIQVTTPPAPFPLVTAFTYDPDGRLLATQKSANGMVLATTGASYTLTGKLASATDANGNVTRYAYDAVDRLASVTDAAGRVTTFSYDALGRLLGVYNPAIQPGALLALGYTPDGLRASLGDANGNVTTYGYDGFDRLLTTTYPDASAETLSYDADGNVLTRETRRGDTITFTYDTLNRRSTKTTPGEPTVTYAYDLLGHRVGVSDTSAAIAAPAASASYTTTMTYDALNRPISVGWTPAPSQTAPAASGVSFAYGYDPTNRRVSASATDNSWWSYPAGAGTLSYTANTLNQYTAVGAVTPTYDKDGNLASDGSYTYCYDAESRLTAVLGSGTCASPGTTVASYAYDGQGRRKAKTAGGTTTILVTDADDRVVLEYDGTTGALGAWYAYGLGPAAVLNQMNLAAGTRETLIPDIEGSIIGTLDSGSGVLTKSGYQPFGENTTVLSGTFRYTGQRFDPETAGSIAQPSGLYDYRARIYSPTWGRFLQPDPLGYAGGSNLYAYVNNDPLNLTDPSGLWGVFSSYGLTAVAGSGPYTAATATNLSIGAKYQINGALITGQIGGGIFITNSGSVNAGTFVTSQAELTGLTPSGNSVVASTQPTPSGVASGVLGASISLGRGFGITTANSSTDLLGPSHVTQIDLGLISIQYSVGQSRNGTPVYSLSIGGAVGLGLSSYDTNTSTIFSAPLISPAAGSAVSGSTSGEPKK